MSFTYGKSTYQNIVDSIKFDINEPDKLANLQPESILYWILDAEKQICDRMMVKDEYVLGLNDGVKKYYHRDRPVISGATNATPIVISSTAHGLAVADRISINGISGNTAANGQRYVSAKTTDAFTIKEAVDITNASNATPIVITANGHGWATSDTVTITGVLGNTAANVTNNAITVIDVNSFSLDGVTGNATYTSGGLAVKDTVGNADYVSGGRYWKDDEIPTYFKKFFFGDRLWGNVKREVKVCDISELRGKEREITAWYGSYSDDTSPVIMAEGNSSFERYQEVYPQPYSDHNLTLYGQVKITPKDYQSDPLTANIHLSTDYDEAICHYIKYKTYTWLKEHQLANQENILFENEIKVTRNVSSQPIRQRITYT
jgi:hypothetical protein